MSLRELRLHSFTARKFIGVAILTTGLLALYTLNSGLQFSNLKSPWWSKNTCAPQAYANGSWAYRPRTNATNMTSPNDAHAFSGFEGCASSREYNWHLASDNPEQYDRFPKAQSWAWLPAEGCERMRPLDPAALIKDLVEDGGWYLVGDSVTENHFFSLSCILYPHVIASPNYTAHPNFDRSWPQNLYLSPSSPLLPSISFPNGFNISSTPLVTFRRIDLLLSKDELVDIHRLIQPSGSVLEDDRLFSEEAVWTLPVDEYLTEFLAPLPKANYATMVVSTGGHWTVTLFDKVSPPGIHGVLALFEEAMKAWLKQVQVALWENDSRGGSIRFGMRTRKGKKRVVIRAYLPGHESCHDFREPWAEVQPFVWNWYNWGNIWQFNEIFDKLLSVKSKFPDIHYLHIDRPARLRPDAHATGDCLHIMTGAGVLEGWTHYIWHYISREVS